MGSQTLRFQHVLSPQNLLTHPWHIVLPSLAKLLADYHTTNKLLGGKQHLR